METNSSNSSLTSLIGFFESRGFVFTLTTTPYLQHYSTSRRFILRHDSKRGLVVHKIANLCFDKLFTTDRTYALTEQSKYGILDWALSN